MDSKVVPTLTGCFILARYRERGDLQGLCGHNRVGGCPQCSAASTAAELSIASRRDRGRGEGIGDREKSDQGTELGANHVVEVIPNVIVTVPKRFTLGPF